MNTHEGSTLAPNAVRLIRFFGLTACIGSADGLIADLLLPGGPLKVAIRCAAMTWQVWARSRRGRLFRIRVPALA